MDRREALKATSIFLGYTLTAGTAAALLGGCKAEQGSGWKAISLNSNQSVLLAEICETILPKTDTPGAKDALCDRYIDELLSKFCDEAKRKHIIDQLTIFDEKSKAKYSKAFVALNGNEKEEILGIVAQQSKTYKGENDRPHIFSFVKEATVSGYFSSEIGAKGGLCLHLPVPGPYKGCIDYATVGKAYVL
jgi:Gluconate 2-dehydrogenase subunit 3